MKKSFLFFFLLYWSCFNSTAQSNPEDYTLLWKITGNGLEKPSYVFGTMHVRNKKAFEFSDSVLLKLREVDVFAAEINMDSSVSETFRKALLKAEDELFEEETLSDNELNQLDLDLNEFGFDKKRLKGKSFIEIKDMINRAEDENAQLMPAYLDLYLYQLSKNLGLETRGLEPLEGRKYFRDSLNATQKDVIFDELGNLGKLIEKRQEFIDIYHDGNLDKIWNYYQQYLDLFDPQYFLYERNRKMVKVFEPIMMDKSMFIAVGCAHLPGKDGIIDILRKRGYEVNPVNANHRIDPDDIEIDVEKKEWSRYINEKDGFSAELPYPVKDYDMFGGLFKMKVSTNIMGNHAFIYFSLPASLTQMQGMADIPKYVDENFPNRSANSKPPNLVKFGNIDYYEFEFGLTPSTAEKGWFTAQNGYIYAILYSTTEKNTDTPEAKRVMNSVQFLTPEKQSETDQWKTHYDKKGGFQIDFPGEFNFMEREITYPDFEHPTSMQLYMSIDQQKGTLALLRWMDLPPGSYYDNDSSVFQNMFSEISATPETYEFDKNRERDISSPYAIAYEFQDTLLQESYVGKVRLYLRGNRHYFLLLQSANPSAIDGGNHFLESFELVPFSSSDLSSHTYNGVSVKLPGNPFLSEENDGSYSYDPIPYQSYETKDNLTGISYLIRVRELPEYYRISHSDSIFSEFTPSFYFIDQTETGISITQNPEDGKFSKTGYLTSETSTAIVKFDLEVQHNKLVEIYANIHPSDSISSSVLEIFNSLEIQASDSSFVLFDSKSAKILDDLTATDSVTFHQAKDALDYYSFDTLDIPALAQALQQKYQDSLASFGSVSTKLFQSYLEASQELNETFFLQLYDTHPEFRVDIIDRLLDDTTNRSKVFELLRDKTIDNQYYYQFNNIVEKLMDSSRVSYTDFQKLMVASEKVIPMRQPLINLISSDRHRILNDEQKQTLLDKTRTWYTPKFDSLSIFPDSLINSPWELRNCIELYSILKAKDQRDLVAKVMNADHEYLVSEALLFQMRNDIKINKNRLNWILEETISGWNLLYTMDKENLKFNPIHKKYLKSEALQVMALRALFEYDEVSLHHIEFHSKAASRNKTYGLYTFSFDDSEERYLAIVQTFDFKTEGIPEIPYVDYHYEPIKSKKDEIDFTGILLQQTKNREN